MEPKPALTPEQWAARDAAQKARQQIMRENPFDSLHSSMVFAAKDWSLDRRDAWIYGIVCGWDGDMEDLQALHGWTPEACERLKRLHQRFIECAQQTDSILCKD